MVDRWPGKGLSEEVNNISEGINDISVKLEKRSRVFMALLQINFSMIAELDIKVANVQQAINILGYLFHWTEIVCISTE